MTALATMPIMGRRGYGTGSLYLKDGYWYGRWYEDGRRRARKLGQARTNTHRDGMTKRDAEQILRQILLGVADSAARPADQTTVSELGVVLLANLEKHGRKPSHVRSSGYHLSVHIGPLLGDLEARSIDESDVRRLIDRMLRDGKSPKMVRNVIGTLHSVLRLAVERRLLDRNPCEFVQLPRVPKSTEIRFLTPVELERVLEAAPGPDDDVTQAERDQWPLTRLLVLTAAMTGMRLGELRGLRWQDLDLGAMKVRVRFSYVRGRLSSPKSERSVRAVPIGRVLVAELEAHHRSTVWNQDGDFVLAHPHTGRPMDDTRLLLHFKAALRRADVRPVRLHDLRHTFATTVAASGQVSMRTLQEWMGHESITTTQVYAAYMPGERESELIDAIFGTQFGAQLSQHGATGVPDSARKH